MALSIKTPSITTLKITTLSIMTIAVKPLLEALNVNDTEHNDTHRKSPI